MAPTPTISPISSARIQPRAGITYWATAPAGYFSTDSFSAASSSTSASTASTSSAVAPTSTSASVTSSSYSTVTPMASGSTSSIDETFATEPATPASSTQTHSSDHTAVAVAASISAVVALLLVVGGASYWRKRRLRRRQQSYHDYQYPRSSSEKKRAPSPPTLFVDISPTNSAYPTPFDSHSSVDRSSGSHYLSSDVSSVHRSDFFSASPSSSTEPQTASTDIISSFPFPMASPSLPTLPAISVTLVSPTSAELTAWATAQRLLTATHESENPFRTPRESIASTRSRTVSDRPTGARPLHSRTPSLGSLSRAASPPPLHRTASVTRLHSRSASMSNLIGVSTRIHSRSVSSANLSMYMQRPDTSTSMLSMDDSAESSDISSVPTPTTLAGAAPSAPAIHEAEEENEESEAEVDSPVDPQVPARPTPRPSPLPNVDPNDFAEPVSERRALRNRHSASLLTQASGISIATLPSYDAGLAAGEWHVAGGRSTPTPAYELNLDRERVVSAGGWSTAATHASCDFDSMLAGNTGSWHAASLMGIFSGHA
ncbi:unnamed protein product [Peniophora sp. CBMAI 1063]|nr:unnamed protein product [Peniophora sp. CBMAI 1063]